MNRVVPQIQNGRGRLVFNELFLVDLRETAYLDLPTSHGSPYRFQFKFGTLTGPYSIPHIQVSKFSSSILEVMCWFADAEPGYVATQNWVDISIAGLAYKALFVVSKIHNHCGRVEITLFDV